MKQFFLRFPFGSRMVLSLLLGFAAIVLSGILYTVLPLRHYFPFVAEVLIILATGLMLRSEGQNLSALGLNPSFRNIAYLFWGLGIGVLALLLVSWLRTLYTGESWHFSTRVNSTALVKSLYFVLPSVIVQELMFRGYLFTKTINRYGLAAANVIFSILFMLVHVLDREVLQNPGQLVFLAVSISVGHLWFATALLRSQTILFPIGLHWGNNWAAQHLVGLTDNQQSVFYLTGHKLFTTWPPFVIMLVIFNVFYLLVTGLIWKGSFSTPQKTATV